MLMRFETLWIRRDKFLAKHFDIRIARRVFCTRHELAFRPRIIRKSTATSEEREKSYEKEVWFFHEFNCFRYTRCVFVFS